MNKYILSLTCTAALALTGCETLHVYGEPHELSATLPSSQLDMSSNTVVPNMHVESIHFASGRINVPMDSASALMAFRDRGIQSVSVYGPKHDKLGEQRMKKIRSLLRSAGVVSTRIGQGENEYMEPNEYRVEVNFMTVVAPKCPNWDGPAAHNYYNLPHSNMGCALATSFGSQIMHPEDLLAGSGDYRPDTITAAKAVENYRTGTPAAVEGDSGDSSSDTTQESSE